MIRLVDVAEQVGITLLNTCGRPALPYLGWGTGFADFDNDGLLDIFVAERFEGLTPNAIHVILQSHPYLLC